LSVCLCVTICLGTLCYSFSFNNQTDQGDETEGLQREGLEMERYIGKRQIGEGGWEKTFHCLIQTKEKRRFTVPPAVALLNNISSGILWRIFSQTGIFAGFSLHIINFAVRISKAAMDRGHYIFRVLRNSFGVRHSSGGCSVAQKDAA
jgi:hypothetical protein